VQPDPPSQRKPMDVLFWTVFASGTLLGLVPIWISDLLPVLDAASHLHVITIIHNHAQTPLFQHHYATVDAIVPYISYYQLVDWLAYIGGVEWANKVVLSVSVASLPLAALHLIRRAGHDRWLVLGIFPWMLNADFFMGFFNYLMSIPVFLWILAEHLRFMQRPTWRRGFFVACLLIFMAITHYLLWGIMLVLLPAIALLMASRVGWKAVLWWPLRDAFLVIPSIAVLLPWFLSYFVFADDVMSADQASLHGATLSERLRSIYAGDHLTPLGNFKQLFDRMFDQFAEQPKYVRGLVDLLVNRPGEIVTTAWLAGTSLWLLGAVKRPAAVVHDSTIREPVRHRELNQSWMETHKMPSGWPSVPGTSYVGWALVLVTAAYFILPQHLNRPIILYGVNFRLVEVLGILAICALPTRPGAVPRFVRFRVWAGTALLAIAALVMPIATAGNFMLARTEYGSIRAAMASIPPGQRVLTLRRKRESRYLRNPIFSNIGEYYAIARHGYVPYSFADSSSKPVVARREHAIPAPIWYDHGTYSHKKHGRYFDYIVIYRGFGEKTGSWERSLRDWHTVYHRDRWLVLRNPQRELWPELTDEDRRRAVFAVESVELLLELVGLDMDEDYHSTDDVLFQTMLGENMRMSPDEKRDRQREMALERASREAAEEAGAATPTADAGADVPVAAPASVTGDTADEPPPEPDEANGRDMGIPQGMLAPPMPSDMPPAEVLAIDPLRNLRAAPPTIAPADPSQPPIAPMPAPAPPAPANEK